MDTPTVDQLLAVMREVRDSSSYLLNPHERTCIGGGRDGVCNCSRARRHTAAWRAFHDALAASGVPSYVTLTFSHPGLSNTITIPDVSGLSGPEVAERIAAAHPGVDVTWTPDERTAFYVSYWNPDGEHVACIVYAKDEAAAETHVRATRSVVMLHEGPTLIKSKP